MHFIQNIKFGDSTNWFIHEINKMRDFIEIKGFHIERPVIFDKRCLDRWIGK